MLAARAVAMLNGVFVVLATTTIPQSADRGPARIRGRDATGARSQLDRVDTVR